MARAPLCSANAAVDRISSSRTDGNQLRERQSASLKAGACWRSLRGESLGIAEPNASEDQPGGFWIYQAFPYAESKNNGSLDQGVLSWVQPPVEVNAYANVICSVFLQRER